MTQYFLSNDVSLSQGGQIVRLSAGKLIDSANQNIQAIIAAGGVLVLNTTNVSAQAALLVKYKRYKGQGLLLDVARELQAIPVGGSGGGGGGGVVLGKTTIGTSLFGEEGNDWGSVPAGQT